MDFRRVFAFVPCSSEEVVIWIWISIYEYVNICICVCIYVYIDLIYILIQNKIRPNFDPYILQDFLKIQVLRIWITVCDGQTDVVIGK